MTSKDSNISYDPTGGVKSFKRPPVAWQLCPKCGGEGTIYAYSTTAGNHYNDCPVCKGKMIISLADGKPPQD